jgi:uncharacterized RDD family membrane protein YckC
MPNNYYQVLGVDPHISDDDLRDATQAYLQNLKKITQTLLNAEHRQAADQQGTSADFYDLLDVNIDANAAEIKQAAQAKIQAARHAYQQLSDAEQRRLHDAELAKAATPPPINAQEEAPAELSVDDLLIADDEDDPYATPDADFANDEEVEQVLASRGSRLGAAIIDIIVMISPVLLAFLYSVMTNDVDWTAFDNANELSEEQVGESFGQALGLIGTVGMVAGFIILLIINLILLHRYAQTVGKRLLGIKIVRTDGSRIGLRRIVFMRIMPIQLAGSIPYMSFGIGISLVNVLLIFTPSRRCTHDLIADTKVVKCTNN